jgi:glucosamine--fructose-6-phosphate aminotransferase (isomerizing)
MCGIVGYIGQNENARDVVINGLRRLEYRGYDSAGICLKQENGFNVIKTIGGVDNLYDALPEDLENGNIAIGHTRWATHGVPSQINAHPHVSMHGTISLVHNGIIENYQTLKTQLIK